MTWLDRLKAHNSDAYSVPKYRHNCQNPGSVSFVGGSEAGIAIHRGPTDARERSYQSQGVQVASTDAADTGNREAFEERAAIMEFDGGLSRADAERMAGIPGAQAEEESKLDLFRWRGANLDVGDLRRCEWCLNFTRTGRCLAAWRGELRAARDWAPTFPDLPQRCVGYLPPADDPDQRPGHERWPDMIEWQARVKPNQ